MIILQYHRQTYGSPCKVAGKARRRLVACRARPETRMGEARERHSVDSGTAPGA